MRRAICGEPFTHRTESNYAHMRLRSHFRRSTHCKTARKISAAKETTTSVDTMRTACRQHIEAEDLMQSTDVLNRQRKKIV